MPRPESAPLLAVSKLNVSLRVVEGWLHIIHGLDLRIHRGQRLALIGESGCGKSLTARVLMGLVPSRGSSTSGSVLFDGRELLHLAEKEWALIRGRRISLIFQDPVAALNPLFKVKDLMVTAARRGGQARSPRAAYQKAAAMLARVMVSDPDRILESYPFQLSGGLCQRVLIATAVLNQPDLIVADEPGTALDVTTQAETLRLMDRLTRENGTSVLFISHNLGVVREFADAVCVMYGGTIVEAAPTRELFQNPRHPYTRALIRAVPSMLGGQIPKGIEGSVPDYRSPPSGCRFRPRCIYARAECGREINAQELTNQHLVRCVLEASSENRCECAAP